MANGTDVNVRRVSLGIVSSVMEDKQFLNEVLSNTLKKYQYIDKKKRSFISYLTKGVIERSIELDAIISTYSSTKISKLNPNIRNVLRLAIYELRYMDSVPESATCNEYVKLSGKVAPVRLKGFVNGILRNMIRDEFSKVKLTNYEKYSLPKWLYEMLQSEYGNVDAIANAFLDNRSLTIRANLTKCEPSKLPEILKEEGVMVEPVSSIDYAFSVKNIDYLENLTSFKKGLFYVQDISSMMVGVKCGVKAEDIVIDVCAAPGGKSIHIAELMAVDKNYKENKNFDKNIDATHDAIADELVGGTVYAFDRSKEKVKLINDNITRTGLENVTAKVGDASKYNESLCEKADIVIADVPCSGIGVIGKKPDIKLRLKEEDIDKLAKLQYDILDNVKCYVKPNGTLLYSTCTVSKRENELNVAKFLVKNKEFTLIEQNQYMPSDIQDGFFIALLRREAK
ncbi:MAG: methyltransferase domain-containing protein [Lachnospiraceae bacterium]|nr:methyltransferase domain-containing protein [Lachnospiraceae bacterium]